MFDSYCIPMNASVWPESTLPDRIIQTISQELEVPEDQIKAPIKGPDDVSFVRHLIMYVLKNRASLSAVTIGTIFNRAENTVFHAVSSIRDYEGTHHKRAKIIQKYLNREY